MNALAPRSSLAVWVIATLAVALTATSLHQAAAWYGHPFPGVLVAIEALRHQVAIRVHALDDRHVGVVPRSESSLMGAGTARVLSPRPGPPREAAADRQPLG